MIEFQNVSKRFRGKHGAGAWVLQDISLTIPAGRRVGVIGAPGAGKTTFLNLAIGSDNPSRGKITRDGTISWMFITGTGLQANLSGRQNATFVCRLLLSSGLVRQRIRYIQEFAELGEAFESPVMTYTGAMKTRLQAAISLAFDFDCLVSDGIVAAGVGEFRKKTAARFTEQTTRSGLLLASSGAATLKKHCNACIWLHNGRAQWYEEVDAALLDYSKQGTMTNYSQDQAIPDE